MIANLLRQRAITRLNKISRYGLTKHGVSIIRQMYDAGRENQGVKLTYKEVSEATGLSKDQVYRICGPKLQYTAPRTARSDRNAKR